MKPGPLGPPDEVGLEGGLSCRPTESQYITHRARRYREISQEGGGGHNSVSITKYTNGSSTRSDTYGVVAAELDEIPSAQDAATYLEEKGYTPDTSIVVAEDSRTDQVPSVGTSELAEVKR